LPNIEKPPISLKINIWKPDGNQKILIFFYARETFEFSLLFCAAHPKTFKVSEAPWLSPTRLPSPCDQNRKATPDAKFQSNEMNFLCQVGRVFLMTKFINFTRLKLEISLSSC